MAKMAVEKRERAPVNRLPHRQNPALHLHLTLQNPRAKRAAAAAALHHPPPHLLVQVQVLQARQEVVINPAADLRRRLPKSRKVDTIFNILLDKITVL